MQTLEANRMNSVKPDNQEVIPSQVQTILHLFDTTYLTLQQIAEVLGTSYKVVWNRVAKYRTKEQRDSRKKVNYARSKLGVLNPMWGKRFEKHHLYKGECSDGYGYTTVVTPEWYNKKSRRVFTHHVRYCEHHGLDRVPPGMVVHHIDHNRSNNDPSNLVMMTASEHTRLHCAERCRD